jgi:hypothetical protein
MKVLCRINNLHEIKDNLTLDRLKRYIHLSDGQLNLKTNVEYCVYGILFRDNAPWYYLCVYESDTCPSPYPAELFNVINGRLSSYWRLSTEVSTRGGVTSSLVFEEWANDHSFYEQLIEDDSSAIELFKYYKGLMDKE